MIDRLLRNKTALWGLAVGLVLFVAAEGLVLCYFGAQSVTPVAQAPTTGPEPTDAPTIVIITPVPPTDTPAPSPAAATAPPATTGPAATSAPTQPAQPTATARSLVPTPTPGAFRMSSPEYGVHVLLWANAERERDANYAQGAGLTWVKQLFQWNYIEPERGVFVWEESDRIVRLCNQRGLKIIARLDATPRWARDQSTNLDTDGPPRKEAAYARFVEAFVARYAVGSPHGRVHAVEIWNEPNLARAWGDQRPNAAGYVALLQAGYEAAKRADPNVIVVSAGLSPTTASGDIATPDVEYLRQMYAAGARPYFDVLGVHGAGFKAPPEMSPDEVANNPAYNNGEQGTGRVYCFRHVEDLRRVMVENSDGNKQIMILEFGWTSDEINPNYSWFRVEEQEKADYIVRAYQWAKTHWQPWIGAMCVIYVAPHWWTPQDEQYWWAITNPDGTTRPAYEALKAMPK
ncbi:MAG: beta-galactosidase [Chloroflexi bacterium]|nr:beta-galactosidase [Chloroflexota bacterium]MBU1748138.1 beta-galactosidase [Chloroflexota bacterium]